MKRQLVILMLSAAASLAAVAAPNTYYSPDVPTDPATGVYQLPWQIWKYDGAGYGTGAERTVPGAAAVDAVHRLDRPGGWLLSLAVPGDLGGALPGFAEPRDVLRYDPANGYSFFLCAAAMPQPIPPTSNVDAVLIDAATSGDQGDLIVSFDVPTELPVGSGTFHLPADLVRFTRLGPGCGDWAFAGKAFDSLLAGAGIPTSSNVIGAALRGGRTLLALDVPTTLVPSVMPATTYVPGEIVFWDGSAFGRHETLSSWPIGSRLDGVSCEANPGAIGYGSAGLRLDKSGVGGGVVLSWSAGCSQGGRDYAVYEGSLGSWASHAPVTCSTSGTTVSPVPSAGGSRYYLVVPHNGEAEGSFGVDSSGTERPWPGPGSACRPAQVLAPCPL